MDDPKRFFKVKDSALFRVALVFKEKGKEKENTAKVITAADLIKFNNLPLFSFHYNYFRDKLNKKKKRE